MLVCGEMLVFTCDPLTFQLRERQTDYVDYETEQSNAVLRIKTTFYQQHLYTVRPLTLCNSMQCMSTYSVTRNTCIYIWT